MYSLTWGHHLGNGWHLQPGSSSTSSSRRGDSCKRRSAGDATARRGTYFERVQVGPLLDAAACITALSRSLLLGDACAGAGLPGPDEGRHDIWHHVSSRRLAGTIPHRATGQGRCLSFAARRLT